MHTVRKRRAVVTFAVMLVLLVGAALVGRVGSGTQNDAAAQLGHKLNAKGGEKDFAFSSQGVANGGAGGESAEALVAAQQWAEARTAPGIVAPGAYGSAYAELTGLTPTAGTWQSVTAVPYDADDKNYRDYYSNSSGGAGKLVTGRITGLAAAGSNVYAAGANGGVWRSTQGGGNWTAIADSIPSLSSGALELDKNGALWYATGEANTGGTSYVGNGVYRLTNPASGSFTIANRVGGDELESTTINAIRFSSDKVWVATLRGVWSHSLTGDMTASWKLSLVPNPTFLPDALEPYLQTAQELGPTNGNDSISSLTNAPYKNIVNDLAIDPKNANHIVAAVGWRSGDAYNGFYETSNAGASWTKVNPTGAIPTDDIGNVTFAYSKLGDKLYAVNQSPKLLNKLTGTVNSYLDGVYVSNSGSPAGPWSKIAESQKLANSGSALKQSVGGKGYGPGIQSWYNQFLAVDPADSNHVYLGLEEVYETKDGGANWSTVGPYWNFYFSCWGGPDADYNTDGSGPKPGNCPLTTHPDQHSIAFGTRNGVPTVFVGNDGGVYSRPVDGQVNGNGNATDWTTLNDGTMDALQYYAVGVGAANAAKPGTPAGSGAVVSGGLQDNGGSIVRSDGAGRKMSSNFGGDGGDVLVDPADGCNIVQEYVVLSMRVTQTCAHPASTAAFLDLSQSTTFSIAPPDINARFIAPFAASDSNIDQWLAGGNSVWYQDRGFAIRSGSEWKRVKTWANAGRVTTAVAMAGNTAVAAWCGTCNNNGFARGIAVGTFNPATKTFSWVESNTGLPNRYISGVAVDGSTVYAVLNGFSRRFTEGPGADQGHVFKSTDGGNSWVSIDANFPDVPANSIEILADHSLVVGTDLGVVYKSAASSTWQRLGSGLPVTVAIDVERGPDGNIYAATHGRGIWKIALP